MPRASWQYQGLAEVFLVAAVALTPLPSVPDCQPSRGLRGATAERQSAAFVALQQHVAFVALQQVPIPNVDSYVPPLVGFVQYPESPFVPPMTTATRTPLPDVSPWHPSRVLRPPVSYPSAFAPYIPAPGVVAAIPFVSPYQPYRPGPRSYHAALDRAVWLLPSTILPAVYPVPPSALVSLTRLGGVVDMRFLAAQARITQVSNSGADLSQVVLTAVVSMHFLLAEARLTQAPDTMATYTRSVTLGTINC